MGEGGFLSEVIVDICLTFFPLDILLVKQVIDRLLQFRNLGSEHGRDDPCDLLDKGLVSHGLQEEWKERDYQPNKKGRRTLIRRSRLTFLDFITRTIIA